jgi:hypothetical protein
MPPFFRIFCIKKTRLLTGLFVSVIVLKYNRWRDYSGGSSFIGQAVRFPENTTACRTCSLTRSRVSLAIRFFFRFAPYFTSFNRTLLKYVPIKMLAIENP